MAAINKLAAAGLHFWDYGNAFLLEASNAGGCGYHTVSGAASNHNCVVPCPTVLRCSCKEAGGGSRCLYLPVLRSGHHGVRRGSPSFQSHAALSLPGSVEQCRGKREREGQIMSALPCTGSRYSQPSDTPLCVNVFLFVAECRIGQVLEVGCILHMCARREMTS